MSKILEKLREFNKKSDKNTDDAPDPVAEEDPANEEDNEDEYEEEAASTPILAKVGKVRESVLGRVKNMFKKDSGGDAEEEEDEEEAEEEEGPLEERSTPLWKFWTGKVKDKIQKKIKARVEAKEEQEDENTPGWLASGMEALGLGERPETCWDRICPEISRPNRMIAFAVFAGLSGLFLCIAFFIGLPMFVISPSKFSLPFSLGCMFLMCALAALEGPASFCARLWGKQRIVVNGVYLSTLVGTLYVSFLSKGYIIVVCFVIMQGAALAWYVSSFFPGGERALKFMAGLFCSGVKKCFTSCLGS